MASSFSLWVIPRAASTQLPVVPQADIFIGDLTAPRSILDHPHVQELVASGKPTAVLAVAVMHFILDESRPVDLLTQLLEPFPAGSYFVFSHGTADSTDDMPNVVKLYNRETRTRGVRGRVDSCRRCWPLCRGWS